ncbi:MAG: glycosyltransferase family 9 protein [Endozoicomonas sp.]
MSKRPELPVVTDITNIQRVLVTMTDGHLGNLVVAIPVIRQMAEEAQKQGISIRFLIDAPFCELLEALLGQELIIPYPRRELNTATALKKVRAAQQLIKSVRSFKPQMTVDLYGTAQPSVVAGLSGADLRVGPERSRWYSRFLTNKIKPFGQPAHRVGGYHLIAAAAGLCGDIHDKEAVCDEAILDQIRLRIKGLGRDARNPLVLLHPGAGKKIKIWPPERFAELADRLTADGNQVAVIGAGADQPLCEKIIKISKSKIINLCNCFSIMELYHLFFLADVLIGNDSGPSHLAALTPIRLHSIFGPTDPVYWKPLSENCSVITRDYSVCDFNCKPCARRENCISDIDVDRVFNTVATAA